MKKFVLFLVVFLIFPVPTVAATVLQVGAFAEKKNARSRAEKLEDWGFKTKFQRSGEGYHRVRTYPLSPGEVESLENKLARREIPYFTVEEEPADTPVESSASTAPELLTIDEVEEKISTVRGTEYLWGGQAPEEGFDCSGLLYWLFSPGKIPRTVSEMWIWVDSVNQEEIRPGDFVFFRFDAPRDSSMPDHVGLYLGEDRFVHASEQHGVTRARLDRDYYQQRLTGIGRPSQPLIKPPFR